VIDIAPQLRAFIHYK